MSKELEEYLVKQKASMEEFIDENHMEEKKHRTCEMGPLHPEQEYMDFMIKSAKAFVEDKETSEIITR